MAPAVAIGGLVERSNSHMRWGVQLGYRANTTNNQMELLAVIKGLEALKEDCLATVYSDSKYVVQGITGWIQGWMKNQWRNSNKQPLKIRVLATAPL